MSNGTEEARHFWTTVIERTVAEGSITFPRFFDDQTEVPRPEDSGILVHHVGELKGQLNDWRASFRDDERGFHAVEYVDRYDCHLDRKDPFKDPLGHLVEDSPGTLALGIGLGLLAAGVTIYALTRKK